LQEHQAIYDGIMARDPVKARDAAHQHMTTALKTQQQILDAERRLEASIRRLERSDLVAPQKRRPRAGA
jgi:GntR family transcriptional repressor for pyruvate dehydrogenase complex